MGVKSTVIPTRDHSALRGLTSGDDHTQYQKESEKEAVSGYPGLDENILIPIAQLPTGTGVGQVALGDHTHPMAVGTYAGDDSANREINVGFTPDFVIVVALANPPATTPTLCFAVSGAAPMTYNGIDYFVIAANYWQGISANGFQCGADAAYCANQTGVTYMYFAIKQ